MVRAMSIIERLPDVLQIFLAVVRSSSHNDTAYVKLQLRTRFIHVGVDTSRYALLIGGQSLYPPCVS